MPAGAGDSMHSSSVTYKSIVAYDGTDFEGFQRQRAGIRTVQASLETALSALGWGERAILAAGRTDRGVHAEGQVISYQLSWKHAPQVLSRALNGHLPGDIAIRDTEVAPYNFHPRFSANSRHYRYSLFVDAHRQPLFERYAMRLKQAPDIGQIQQAVSLLVGQRDYRAFGPSPRPQGTTIRAILRASWAEMDGKLVFDIEADAFLQHMVRRITAALIELGMGRLTVAHFTALLEDPAARWQGALAPSCGLCLMNVKYAAE
jgi:tRNA pseudouridine38-40 synthase